MNKPANCKNRFKRATIIPLVFLSLWVGCAPSNMIIYIAPADGSEEVAKSEWVSTSIEAGFEKVTQIRESGGRDTITIHFLAGEHRLRAPIRIPAEAIPLKLVGAGTQKSILKGSKQLDLTWKKYEGAIWSARISDTLVFDQLFINGALQTLARYPNYDENGGHWQGHAADAIAPERVKKWKNPEGAFIHAMHSGEWGGFHYQATGKDENGKLTLKGGHQNNRPSKLHEKYIMVENVYEELDEQGEWYRDRDYLYYWPPQNVDLSTAVIESEGEETNTISDLMRSYQSHNWKGKMNLVVFRNQPRNTIKITTK